ncbi:MAG: hypothetical protein ACE5OZ_01180 [Candidatus Heimdallarchaeota archaeon]
MEDLIDDLWQGYFDWYATRIYEGISAGNIVALLLGVFVIYIILMLLGAVFPIVDRILNIVFLPFRIIHVWMHAREMKLIQTRDAVQKPGPHQGTRFMSSGLTLAIIRKEWAGARLMTDNPRIARRVAFAPLKIFLPAILLVLVSSPLLRLIIADRWLSILIHMYLLLGCLRSLPTAEDHYFLYYAVMMNTTFSQWYFIYMIPLFTFLSCVNYATGMDGTAAVLGALAYTYVYFILLMLCAVHYCRYRDPKIHDIPYWKGFDPFDRHSGVTPGQEAVFLGFDDEA